jgi:hypothetical protein
MGSDIYGTEEYSTERATSYRRYPDSGMPLIDSIIAEDIGVREVVLLPVSVLLS